MPVPVELQIIHTGDAVSRILVVWWKREAICAACRLNKSASLLNHLHRFPSRRWGPNNFGTESVSHCARQHWFHVAWSRCLRKRPYGDAAKKVAKFGQAGMIERITAGAR